MLLCDCSLGLTSNEVSHSLVSHIGKRLAGNIIEGLLAICPFSKDPAEEKDMRACSRSSNSRGTE